jgi:hypothetical protein
VHVALIVLTQNANKISEMPPQSLYCPFQDCPDRLKVFEKIDDVRVHVNEKHAAILMFTELPCRTRVVTKDYHEKHQIVEAIQLHIERCLICPQDWKQATRYNSRVTCPFSSLNGPEKCRTWLSARRDMCEHLGHLPNEYEDNHGQMRKTYSCPGCEFKCEWRYGSGDDPDEFWKHILHKHGGSY